MTIYDGLTRKYINMSQKSAELLYRINKLSALRFYSNLHVPKERSRLLSTFSPYVYFSRRTQFTSVLNFQKLTFSHNGKVSNCGKVSAKERKRITFRNSINEGNYKSLNFHSVQRKQKSMLKLLLNLINHGDLNKLCHLCHDDGTWLTHTMKNSQQDYIDDSRG